MTDPQIANQILSIRSHVDPFHAMDVLAKANAMRQNGADIAYLCVGQPSALLPAAARQAAVNHLEGSAIGYTDAAGRADLRERLARHVEEAYGTTVDPPRLFVTTGSSAGFILAFLALFDPGDTVAIATPGYPAYRNILKALSLDIEEIETVAEDGWILTPQLVRAAHARKPLSGLLVASPANPTGTMMSGEALQELIACCDELGIQFISDEIYHGLTYPEETGIAEVSALQFSDKAIIINSFSKYFCMTGWRVGWMVLPPELIRPVERLSQSLYISAPELSQVAALHALDCRPELETVRLGYLANRRLLLDRLPALGFDEVLPVDGAFYAYANATRFTNDTMEFAERMLVESHVAVTPGLDFDRDRGHRYLRFSFAGDHETMIKAMDSLEDWLA